ncbi:protein anachronism-like [Anopheles albimanus]|uniref:protein anachronism-like n=1 Tax=Anopheles albimanus TaxID=7167 RepID=UPI00164159D9|nr:protein anachronism-like [Anopheles albimanus]
MRTWLSSLALLVGLVLALAGPATGAPHNQRDLIAEADVAAPESKMIDFENLTESEREEFTRENINITALKIQQRVLREKQNLNRTSGGPLAITATSTDRDLSDRVKTRKEYANQIIHNIMHNIESNIMRNDSAGQLGATHEMAFSAVCELPKNTNMSQWNEDNTWNLYFRLAPNKQYSSVNSAILRLYMNGINSTGTRNQRGESDNCKNPAEQMIRITASVYYRKNRKDNPSPERKKRICSSITITQSYRGWISMDTLLAVKLWDKPNRNFGIAIDVEDQEDRPLRASDFFQPPDCSMASKTNATTALPWNFFRKSLAWTADEMDNVPHQPRIDIAIHKPMHHNHRMYRTKHHYGYNVRYHPYNGSTTGSYSSNSYEQEQDVESRAERSSINGGTAGMIISANQQPHHHQHHHHHHANHHKHQQQQHQQHHFQHQQHPIEVKLSQKRRRHLSHRSMNASAQTPISSSVESEENQSVSSSSAYDSTASGSIEDRQL